MYYAEFIDRVENMTEKSVTFSQKFMFHISDFLKSRKIYNCIIDDKEYENIMRLDDLVYRIRCYDDKISAKDLIAITKDNLKDCLNDEYMFLTEEELVPMTYVHSMVSSLVKHFKQEIDDLKEQIQKLKNK